MSDEALSGEPYLPMFTWAERRARLREIHENRDGDLDDIGELPPAPTGSISRGRPPVSATEPEPEPAKPPDPPVECHTHSDDEGAR